MCNVYKIIGWLNETKKTLDICMYSLNSELLTNAIIDAHKRGVHVRIIVDEDNIRSTWKFGTMGIAKRVKLMQFNAKMLMHHKFIIIDNKKVILGSMNWTVNAVRRNWENVFLTNKYQIVDPFRHEFKTIWKQFDQ
jgi:phosphatidylserine/phosphatidylglycerophosphate/cardiolipin synthase-like enzyme